MSITLLNPSDIKTKPGSGRVSSGANGFYLPSVPMIYNHDPELLTTINNAVIGLLGNTDAKWLYRELFRRSIIAAMGYMGQKVHFTWITGIL